MKQPDIVIFMSDQHGADYSGWGTVPVDTPVLNEMRAGGTSFDAAYTSCPLCVPARMSMMSALLPSKTGIYGNQDTLPNTTPCFTHALVDAGYETVLAGRMHFVGTDQRHGFTKRIAPEITPVSWKRPIGKIQEERGALTATFFDGGATELVGAGESPVAYYDRMVIDSVLDYLSEDHEKPQFILVGTYGPHFPYVTEETMYRKYYNRVQVPKGFREGAIPKFVKDNRILNSRLKPSHVTDDVVRGCLAAYCGQIEVMDGQIGEVREAALAYAGRNENPLVFGYVSDHGDMAGENRLFGKRCYFDKAAKVPMIFTGDGIPAGKVVKTPVSLMDLGPTVCELANCSFEIGDGVSLVNAIHGEADGERLVISQQVDSVKGELYGSIMLRYQDYKYICYYTEPLKSLLFNMKEDPEELHDLAKENPDLVRWFKKRADEIADPCQMVRQAREHQRNAAWFARYEEAAGYDDSERWQENPPQARGNLSIRAAYNLEQLKKNTFKRTPE